MRSDDEIPEDLRARAVEAAERAHVAAANTWPITDELWAKVKRDLPNGTTNTRSINLTLDAVLPMVAEHYETQRESLATAWRRLSDRVETAEAERDTARAEVAQLRERISPHGIETALLQLADTLDPEEGPVILAWSVQALAERVAQLLAGDTGQKTP